MARKINMKAEKAKRNQAYALKFKKKRKRASRPSAIASLGPKPEAQRSDGHPAVCNACGTNTTVPFKPVQDKPVFCRPCFDRAG